MDFKLNRERAVCCIPLLNSDVTQTVEHDFILPDYCPDIFRVLKCFVTAGVTSTGINGSRLTFELSVTIRVIYRSSDCEGIFSVEHTQEYSKSLELPADTVNPTVSVDTSTEYVNCRVVDRRRLDVRSGVICRVNVGGERSIELVTDAYGAGIQLKKASKVYPSKRLTCAKRITVIEELELSAGKPAFGSVLRSEVQVKKGEQKIIPGKLITKGEAQIGLLYLPKDSNEKPPAIMKFSIPFSQIMDIEGIDEGYEVSVDITAGKCVIMPKGDETSTLECELVLLVNIAAVGYDSGELVTDAYSTRYECECLPIEGDIELPPKCTSVNIGAGCELSCAEGEISQVYDMWCENAALSIGFNDEKGCAYLYGRVTFALLGRLTGSESVYVEKECAFEKLLEGQADSSCRRSAVLEGINASYTLGENGSASASAQIEAIVKTFSSSGESVLNDIRLDFDKQKKHDKGCAVKICYTNEGESLWDVAKRYSTAAGVITEENPPDDGCRALIIPMKN